MLKLAHAFTLIEMLVVVAILGGLAALLFPALSRSFVPIRLPPIRLPPVIQNQNRLRPAASVEERGSKIQKFF